MAQFKLTQTLKIPREAYQASNNIYVNIQMHLI